MRHIDKIGFTLCLIGLGGLAEAYGNGKAISISLVMIIAGGIMVAIGEGISDAKSAKRSDSDIDRNCLNRLYFLR